MILVTVGAQMPFDRLVRAVDAWAGSRLGERTARRNDGDVFAQIGPTPLRPRHLQWAHFLTPAEFRAKVQLATLLVAHAGMGSILTALEIGRPILVMPRRGDLHETRNDHQVATAKRFAAQGRVSVAMDEHELVLQLNRLIGGTEPARLRAPSVPQISRFASPELIEAVRAFIANGPGKAAPPLRRDPQREGQLVGRGGVANEVAHTVETVARTGAQREHV